METPFRELWSLGDSGPSDVWQPAPARGASPAITASLRLSRDERHTFKAAALSQPGNREQRQAQSGSRSSYALCVHTSRKVHADSAPQAHCDRAPQKNNNNNNNTECHRKRCLKMSTANASYNINLKHRRKEYTSYFSIRGTSRKFSQGTHPR